MNQDIWSLLPGTVLRVSHGIYDRVGLVSDRTAAGERAIISFSAQARGLIEEPFSAFSRNQVVTNDGYPGQLAPWALIQRARAVGSRRYSWLWFNCEHFIRHAHDLPEESPQLQRWVALATVAGCLVSVSAR